MTSEAPVPGQPAVWDIAMAMSDRPWQPPRVDVLMRRIVHWAQVRASRPHPHRVSSLTFSPLLLWQAVVALRSEALGSLVPSPAACTLLLSSFVYFVALGLCALSSTGM